MLRAARRARRPAVRASEGFTIVELMISIMILGLIMGAIVSTFFIAMQTNKATNTRLDVAHDAQMVAAVFGQDVAGGTALATTGTPNCGSLGSTYTLVLDIVGASFNPASLPTAPPTASPAPALWPARAAVTYVTKAVTISGVSVAELHRWVCATAPSATPDSDQVVARQLLAANGTSVACYPANNQSAPIACSTSTVDTVKLTLTSRTIDPPIQSVTTTLIGNRRTT